MNVQSIGNLNTVSTTPVRSVTESPVEPQPAPEQTTTVNIAKTADGETKQKGVLRLLQEGHFKGVSDIRLRINFHDEVAAMDAAAARAAAEPHEQSVTDAVTGQLGTLTADQTAAASDISGSFTGSVATAFADYAAGSVSTSELTTSLQASFDDLVAGLTSALDIETAPEPEPLAVEPDIAVLDPKAAAAPTTAVAAPVAETVVSQPDPAAPLPDSTDAFTLETFIAGLTAAFESALAELTLTLESASVLPDLSQPHGNGKAYDKFLAVYNNLAGGTSTAPTDTTA